MVWQIEFSPVIEKEFSRLDPQIARRLTNFLRSRVAMLDNPRSIGEALSGPVLGKLWKYRVGDYRIICDIKTASSRSSRSVSDTGEMYTGCRVRKTITGVGCS